MGKFKISVSIIVPVYNVEDYIHKCIVSVSEQTYGGPIECILVDDCGKDNSIAIAERFIQSYEGRIQFRIIHREANGGLSAARNTGINNSTGDYLYFLDSDDYIRPDAIDLLVQLADKYVDVDMVQGGVLSVDGGKVSPYCSLKESRLPFYTHDHSFIHDVILRSNRSAATAWNRLVRKDFILQNQLYFVEGILNEDILWKFKLAQTLQSVSFLHDDIYYYVIREGSIVNNNHYRERHAFDYVRNVSLLVSYCDDAHEEDLQVETLFCFNSICKMMREGGEDCWSLYLPLLYRLKEKSSDRAKKLIQRIIDSPQLVKKSRFRFLLLTTKGWPLYIQYRNDSNAIRRLFKKLISFI